MGYVDLPSRGRRKVTGSGPQSLASNFDPEGHVNSKRWLRGRFEPNLAAAFGGDNRAVRRDPIDGAASRRPVLARNRAGKKRYLAVGLGFHKQVALGQAYTTSLQLLAPGALPSPRGKNCIGGD